MADRSRAITLDGKALTTQCLDDIAAGAMVDPDPQALSRMEKTNALILKAARSSKLVYGVTTGLGPKVLQSLSADSIAAFARSTVRGRAHAVGTPLPRPVVRAAMATRLNTLLTGASGASPNVARHIAACLNADLVPVIGETASTGASDLLWGASLGLALIGEGSFLGEDPDDASAVAIERAGIEPLDLGPRDGLALASHSCFTAAIAALGHRQACRLWDSAQTAAALSFEAFRANLSPLDPDILAVRPQPGQMEAARDLAGHLSGSGLAEPGAARRLQDPLSLRTTIQVHGSVYAALKSLEAGVLGEINGASDNPVVLPERGEILSAGGFLNPYLGVVLVATNHALVHLAAQITARTARMMSGRFTDLPTGLLGEAADMAGLAPTAKVCEALFAEIAHLAAPPPVYPAFAADGVEDTVTHTAISAKALMEINLRLSKMIAHEMIVAVQAIEMRGLENEIAPGLRPALQKVRGMSPKMTGDRSMTGDLESLSELVLSGGFG